MSHIGVVDSRTYGLTLNSVGFQVAAWRDRAPDSLSPIRQHGFTQCHSTEVAPPIWWNVFSLP